MRKLLALTTALLSLSALDASAAQAKMYLLTYTSGSTQVAEFQVQPSWSPVAPTCSKSAGNCTALLIDSLDDPSDSSSYVGTGQDSARYISITAAPWGITGTINKCLTTAGCDVSGYYKGAKIYTYDLASKQVRVNGVAPASTSNTTDCTFNWLEDQYPAYVAPSRPTSQSLSPYQYRYYSKTNSYLGVSSSNNHLYYVSSNGGMVDLGTLTSFASQASCQ
jgi:hypothetical protein